MTHRILIVDDNRSVHSKLGEDLTQAGFDVRHAMDGISAINMIFTDMPDLVLLDIYMPKLNGYQVCRLLKDHPVTRSLPILIMTSTPGQGLFADPKQWSFQTGA